MRRKKSDPAIDTAVAKYGDYLMEQGADYENDLMKDVPKLPCGICHSEDWYVMREGPDGLKICGECRSKVAAYITHQNLEKLRKVKEARALLDRLATPTAEGGDTNG